MDDGVSIDVGSALPYVVDSLFSLFGKDVASKEWKAKLDQWMKLSVAQASTVQCVGMSEPIPIRQIYQRTTIYVPGKFTTIDIIQMLSQGKDFSIFAGPGWGKTTLLHWIFITLLEDSNYLPLLFTLRWDTAVDYLDEFVKELQRNKGRKPHGKQIALLVDGYDEINMKQRRKVSESLALFSSLELGNFYLTCRAHYDIYDLKCSRLELGSFTKNDACSFIEAYSKAYGSQLNGDALINELDRHHLEEFSRHPLMLTLVCILKSSPSKIVPRRTIGLLRRAIDTLAFRWDEAKGISRRSRIPLDGEERVRLLMRIAFEMNQPQASWEAVQKSASAHLELLQVKSINVRDLLHEMARFYGILVPISEESWQFTHRIIHDYLSARYWVESGTFNPASIRDWDIQAAYAASLSLDATGAMVDMLKRVENTVAITECFYNMAPFRPRMSPKQ
jgi:predicted NACHT family NTPase